MTIPASPGGKPGKGKEGILHGANNVQKAYNFLIAHGLTPAQAAGIVGNLMTESGVDPTSQQNGSNNNSPIPGVGFGIAQWTSPGRQQALITFARNHGRRADDLLVQLAFMWKELTQGYKSTYAAIKNAKTDAEAARIYAAQYEAPKSHDYSGRVDNANKVLSQYGGIKHQSPYANPFRDVAGLNRGRVDQGVDYSGHGWVYAIGPGVVTGVYRNAGWPGGVFIAYRLTSGPEKGKTIYVAEHITPAVHIGDKVTSATAIGYMTGPIETGYAQPDGAQALAATKSAEGREKTEDKGSEATPQGNKFLKFLEQVAKTGGTVSNGKKPKGGLAALAAALLGGQSKKNWQDYMDYMYHMGIAPSAEAQAFAHMAAGKKWSVATFDLNLYQQPFFKQEFPGLMKNGAPIMSPTEYNHYFQAYRGVMLGLGSKALDKHQFGYLVQRYGSPQAFAQQFQQRLQAIQIAETNKADFAQLSKTLMARGIIKQPLTKQDVYKIIMREAPPLWTKVWDEADLRMAAVNAGMKVGTDITRNQILGLSKHIPGLAAMTRTPGGINQIQQGFYKIAQDLKQLAPLGRLYQDHGFTPADLAQLEFGGPHQAEIAARAQSALETYKVSATPQAHMVSGNLEAKLGGADTSSKLKTGVQPGIEQPA